MFVPEWESHGGESQREGNVEGGCRRGFLSFLRQLFWGKCRRGVLEEQKGPGPQSLVGRTSKQISPSSSSLW